METMSYTCQGPTFKKLAAVIVAVVLVGEGIYWVYRSVSEETEPRASDADGVIFCKGMSLTEAQDMAINSECGNHLEGQSVCNETTKTWWLDLDIEKEGCSPACVVNVETKQAEINWRCTGLIPN